jgi:hypothetical protein
MQRNGDSIRVVLAEARRPLAADRAKRDEHVPDVPADHPVDAGRIFIGCTGESEAVEMVQQILDEFDIPHVVAEWEESDRRPVPEAVAEKMRDCTAGIVVFSSEWQPSRSTLFQLGAASVLYGERVIAIRETGSNPTFDFGSLPLIHFDEMSRQQSGLDLLRHLRRLGIIKVLT